MDGKVCKAWMEKLECEETTGYVEWLDEENELLGGSFDVLVAAYADDNTRTLFTAGYQ